MAFNNVYRGKKVLITGNTGFKGSWLSAWLLMLGAEVYGYSIVYLPTVHVRGCWPARQNPSPLW